MLSGSLEFQMSKGITVVTLAAVLAAAGYGMAQQKPQDTRTPNAAQNTRKATGSPQQQAANAPVLKVQTRMVVIDVVAKNFKGAPVTDLKPGDLTVLEDGKAQKIRIFNFQH